MAKEKTKLEIVKIQNGITLIALVVTLVVLLILSAITINFLVGDIGIFKTANDAKIQHRIGEILDELNVAESSVSLQKLGKPSLEEYIKYIQDNNIVTEVEKQENGSYLVITEDGYLFQISIDEGENVNDIVIGYVGTAKGPRIKEIYVTGKTSNSISVEVEVANAEDATYKYEYRKEGEDDNSWKLAEESKNNTCNITGLAGNQIYDIKVTVTTKEGSASKITSDRTGKLEVGTIEFEEYVWQGDGTASIVIRNNSTDSSYHLEYRIGVDGQWTEITSGQAITGLTHGQTVYGRLYDGVNEASPANVEILDRSIPELANIALETRNTNTGINVSATVTHIDKQSGVDITKCRWIYNQKSTNIGTLASSYPNKFSNNGTPILLNASEPGIYYLHVLTVDKSGKARETISNSITVTQLVTAITVNPTSITLEEGETSQLTANIVPNDASDQTLTWSSSNEKIATINENGFLTALSGGTTTITVKANGGDNITATCQVTVAYPTVEDKLAEGNYVYYDVNNSKILCVVLYDANSGYGIQIIPMQTLGSLTLGYNNPMDSGSNNFERAIVSYNDAIMNLNLRAADYLNTTYANDARSVGSVPGNKNAQSDYGSFYSGYDGGIRNTDSNYITDLNKMVKLGIANIGTPYWLASRYAYSDSGSSQSYFYIRYMSNGSLQQEELCSSISWGGSESTSISHGLRPVFTLKPEIKVTGGTGMSDNPYTLGT